MITKKIQMYSIIFVLLFCINYGIYAMTDINIINNKYIPIKYIYICVAIIAIYLMTNRDTLLPFLGDCVFPTEIFKETYQPDFDTILNIKVPPNSMVIYWCALPKENKNLNPPQIAYGNYTNYGVVYSNNNGDATLRFKKPQQYKLNFGKILNPHIHYRYSKYPGMFSRIETIYL